MTLQIFINIVLAALSAVSIGICGFQLAKLHSLSVVQGLLATNGAIVTMSACLLLVHNSTKNIGLVIIPGVIWQLLAWQLLRWHNSGWRNLRFSDAVLNVFLGGMCLAIMFLRPELPAYQFFVALGWVLAGLGLTLFLALFIDTTKMAEKFYKTQQ